MYILYDIPCFWYYILGLLVLHFVLTWLEVIQIYHFLMTLSIVLFYFLYSYLLLFLKHVVSPILLELHITQEAPLPPCNFNRSCHIEDNVQLGWGESWERKFLLLMLSYFGNLVSFCLIFKIFKVFILLSMETKNYEV